MSAAPSDSVARANYLRAEALSILHPIGANLLSHCAVPIPLSEFTAAKAVKLSDLSDSERAWLQEAYESFVQHASASGGHTTSTCNVSVFSGIVNVGGGRSKSEPLPAWSELGDVTIAYSVQYTPGIFVAGDKPERVASWSLGKAVVY